MPPKDKDKNVKATYSFDGIDNWVPSAGATSTVDTIDINFDINDNLYQPSFDFEEDLRKKYPALNDAWEHYQNVKQMCQTREKEEDA